MENKDKFTLQEALAIIAKHMKDLTTKSKEESPKEKVDLVDKK